jgi:hypothetical protein
MSALGQKQTFKRVRPMSALPPKADIGTQLWNVRFVPRADIGAGISVGNVRLVCNWPTADNNLGSHQFIISCAQFGPDSLF